MHFQVASRYYSLVATSVLIAHLIVHPAVRTLVPEHAIILVTYYLHLAAVAVVPTHAQMDAQVQVPVQVVRLVVQVAQVLVVADVHQVVIVPVGVVALTIVVATVDLAVVHLAPVLAAITVQRHVQNSVITLAVDFVMGIVNLHAVADVMKNASAARIVVNTLPRVRARDVLQTAQVFVVLHAKMFVITKIWVNQISLLHKWQILEKTTNHGSLAWQRI